MRRKWILNKPVKGIKLNPGHPLSRGLVGCWLMNEGSGDKVFDLSGNWNDGAISGPTWQPEKFGSGLNFVADTNKVTIAHSPSINFDALTDSYSLIFWAKGGSQPSHRLAEKSGGGDYPILIGAGAGTNCSFFLFDGVAAPSVGLIGVWDNRWHQIVFVVDFGTDKLYAYQDGILVSSAENTVTAPTFNFADLLIGNRAGLDRDFVGDIDHMMIYNRALSASEIAQLYRDPFCMFERQELVFLAVALGPANLLSVNAVTRANIKSINAVLIGSVKSINAIA